jgi:hypothetical protein
VAVVRAPTRLPDQTDQRLLDQIDVWEGSSRTREHAATTGKSEDGERAGLLFMATGKDRMASLPIYKPGYNTYWSFIFAA